MKKINKFISIIVPTYNEEKNIENCINSLVSQSNVKTEIIVVDDGSTDQTLDLVKKLPVLLLTQKHQGPAVARNRASKVAKGEILVFVDADMTFDKDFIRDLTEPINEGRYMGTFSKEEYISNWENIWSRCWNYNQNWPKKKMIPDDYPDEGIDFRAILKEEFLKVNGFDNVGYTDTWSLSEKLGYKPHSVKGAKYYHSNPDNLKEVFIQAKWVTKRKYKFGFLGVLIALLRTSLPVSILVGFIKSLRYREVRFIFFKIVYDLGGFLGILEMNLIRKLSK